VIAGSPWPLEGVQLRAGFHALPDVRSQLEVIVLVEDGQSNASVEWPLKNVVELSRHEVNEQREALAPRRSSSVQVDADARLVTVVAGIETGTVQYRVLVRLRLLHALLEVRYLPYVSSVTRSCAKVVDLQMISRQLLTYTIVRMMMTMRMMAHWI